MNNGIIHTPKFVGVEYNFDLDGGAVGNIETGLILPGGALMWHFQVQSLVTCVGAGNINFGIIGNLTLYGVYPAASFGLNTSAVSIITTVESELIISISGAILTAGKIHATWVLATSVGRG